MDISETQLILDLTLEHCDNLTLSNCLFLNKRIHIRVMQLMKPIFNLMTELKRTFYGDIYQGIKFLSGANIKHLKYFWNHEEIMQFLIENCDIHNTDELLEIYGKLYPFSINTKANYILLAKLSELCPIMDDFCLFAKYHYNKLTPTVIGFLVYGAFAMGQYIDVIELILNKGFNVNTLIKIPGSYKTTILNYAILNKIYWLVQIIFDKNPDIFMRDRKGDCAFNLFIPYRAEHESDRDSLNSYMLHLFDTFDILVNQQKYGNLMR